MGQMSTEVPAESGPQVFNNNTNEKCFKTSKARRFMLWAVLVHHLYANVTVMVASSLDISVFSEETRKELSTHIDLALRFMTTWNFTSQTLYVILELALIYRPGTKYTKQLERYNWMHFVSIIWPTTLYIMCLFWPLYNVDRELIFPKVCDLYVPWTSNQSMHTMIIVLLLMEALTSQRDYLPPMKQAVKINFTYMLLYCITLNYTYFVDGVWIYPFLSLMTWSQRNLLYLASFVSPQIFIQMAYYVLGLRCLFPIGGNKPIGKQE